MLHLALPADLLAEWWLGLAIGLPLVGLGVLIQAMCIRTLRRAQTDLMFRRAVSSMLTDGPYRWSRNPMYVGILIWNAGLPLALNTAWLIPLPVILALYLHFWIVPREERYLSSRFGAEYAAYSSMVPRWLRGLG